MSSRFSFCVLVLLSVTFCTVPAGRAVMPPRPGSAAQPPAVADPLRAVGFGHVSRPIKLPFAGKRSGGGVTATGQEAAVAGERALPVLLGETTDRLGGYSAGTFAAELFGSWPSGSMRDYYEQVSYDQFHLSGDVYGWFRAGHNASYYEGSAGCNGLCTYPNCAGGFVRELIALADASGVDWGRYDNDGPDGMPNSGDDDGYVDAVIVVHSGRGGECGGNNYIWSHSFYLRGWGIQAYTTSSDRTGGGKIRIDDYIIQPEQSCWSGLVEIGVFCHEYGHVLGLPDLYDTSGAGAGIGRWGLMATGAWGGDGASPEQPVQMCAWSKSALGWVDPVVVASDGPRELTAVELAPVVLKVWTGGQPAGEYFLVENRQQTLGDSRLPAGGLNIWHIDEGIIEDTWYTNEVNAGPIHGVALEQADGLDQLRTGSNRGDGGDPWPGSGNRTSFSALTTPSSDNNAGGPTEVALTEISPSDLTMTARVTVGVTNVDATPPQVTLLSPNGGENWAIGAQYPIVWQATDAVGVQSVDIRLSFDGGTTYPQTLASGLPNSGLWDWQVPLEPHNHLLLMVGARDAAGNLGQDSSDGLFATSDQYPPAVQLQSPTGGELWPVHSTQTILWAAADNHVVAGIDLLLSTDNGLTWPDTLAWNSANTGSYTWLVPGRFSSTCRLRVRARDGAGLTVTADSGPFTLANVTAVPERPAMLQLGPCVPNPFNPQTTIAFANPADGRLTITVHNLLGRRVTTLLDEDRPEGPGTVRWDGTDNARQAVASGVYFVQACSGGQRALVRVALVK